MKHIVNIVLVAILGWFTAGIGLAQVKSATLTGVVTDPSGLVIAKARITATEQGTKSVFAAESNASGSYNIPYLPQGTYSLTIEAKGFKSFKTDGIVLGTATSVRVNASLSVGAASEVVEVTASSAQLQTESSGVQGSVDSAVIMNIPNINSNPMYYATLQAGVVPTPALYNSQALGVGFSDRQQFSGIRINGGEVGNNDVQIDGLTVQGAAWHESTVLPNRDALQEVRVSTNNFSADTGGGQGVVSFATKSGTDQFHGDLDYRIRNEQLNANGFYNNIQKLSRGKYRVNEASGAVGGPVFLPKLFIQRKERLFFFVSFSRVSHTQPSQGFATVPTELQKTGDFGATLIPDQNGNPIPVKIFDPYSAVPFDGSTTTFVRSEYPTSSNCSSFGCGDFIPHPDASGLALLSAYPKANHTASDNYGDNNYFFSGSSSETRDNLNARLDFHINQNQSLYASGGIDEGSNKPYNAWSYEDPGTPWTNGGGTLSDNNPFASVGYTHVLSPTLVLDVRYGLTRISATDSFPQNAGFKSSDYSKYGMPTNVQSFIAAPGAAPSIGFWNPYVGSNLNQDQSTRKDEHQTNQTVTGSVTKSLGKWTMKNGAEYRVYLGNWADLEHGTPALASWTGDSYTEQYANIDGSSNGGLNTTPQQYGYGGAMLAVGALGWNLDSGSTAKPALAAKYLAVYSQNDWKATPKLTVNLGLRYEVQPGPTERYNRASSVDLTAQNPYATGLTVSNGSNLSGLGAVVFPGQAGYSRNLWDTDWSNLSPRVGLAYTLGTKMVIRGGFGRVFVPSNTGFNANGLIYGAGPFSGGTAAIPYGLNHHGVPVGHFEDVQNTELFPATGAVQSPGLYGNGNAQSSVDLLLRNGFKNGFTDQWNVFFERSFGGWIASAGYVGTKGRELGWRSFPLNGQFNIPWATLQNWQSQWIASNGTTNPGTAQVSNPLQALVGGAHGDIGNTTISAAESMEPYLGLLGQSVYASKGSSMYNAFQVNVKHATGRGLTAILNYTYSHATGLTGGEYGETYAESQAATQQGYLAGQPGQGGVDFRNFNNNNGLLGYDTPQRFVGTVSYDLPFGKGKQFDPGNSVARAVVGGWRAATVVTLQSGNPWGPSCGSENGRCIPTGQPLELPKSLQHWYDGNTPVTLPDGRTFTPPQYYKLKWNPDAFTSQIVQFPNGNYATAPYWLGTTPAHFSQLRLPSFQNVNLTLNRAVNFTERFNLQFLAEATNLLNRTNFLPGSVNTSFGSPILNPSASSNSKVGQNGSTVAGALWSGAGYQSALYGPREITFSLRLNF